MVSGPDALAVGTAVEERRRRVKEQIRKCHGLQGRRIDSRPRVPYTPYPRNVRERPAFSDKEIYQLNALMHDDDLDQGKPRTEAPAEELLEPGRRNRSSEGGKANTDLLTLQAGVTGMMKK